MDKLIDPLNLRGFIDIVTVFCRDNDTEPQNAVSFINLLLNDLDRKLKGVKVPSTLGVQRVYQAHLTPYGNLKPFWDGVVSGKFDVPLLENISLLTEKVGPSIGDLCRILLTHAYYPFFARETVSELQAHFRKGAFEKELLIILKHGFETVSFASPVVFSDGLYQQALTLPPGITRHRLMCLAAEQGSSEAAQELGESLAQRLREDKAAGKEISREDVKTCLRLFLQAGLNASLWNITYLLQQYLDEDSISEVEPLIKIENKLKGVTLHDIVDCLVVSPATPRPRTSRLCLRLHQLLVTKEYGKSFNSLAKMLALHELDIDPQKTTLSRQEVNDYFRLEAIKRGDLFAIQNEGSALVGSFLAGGAIDHDYTQRILDMGRAAGMKRACLNYGMYCEAYNKIHPKFSLAEITSCYESAISDLPGYEWINGKAYLRLGDLEPDENVERRMQLYNQSIHFGNQNAGFHLALLYYNRYESSGKTDVAQLLECHRLLEKHLPAMSPSTRKLASALLKQVESVLPQ